MTGKKVIDIFAGAGGFGLGFTLAGFEHICSLEMDKWACDTLRANNEHHIVEDDISKYKTEKQIAKIVNDTPDIIIGGPPCQGFSYAGRRKKNDPRNQLYLQYLNWVKILSPNIFVIENVKGLMNFKTEKQEYLVKEIERKCKKMGYSVSVWDLNAVNYGVPQNRNRIFIVGSKKKIKIPKPKTTHYEHPDFLPFITVGEAILDLPVIHAKEGTEEMNYTSECLNDYQKWCRKGSKKVNNHVAMKHTDRVVQRYENIINGVSIEEVHDEYKVRKRNGNGVLSKVNYNSNYRHLKADLPSHTIPAHFYSSFVHPIFARNITTREAARLQSFPDKYIFKGKRTIISKKLSEKLGFENYLSQYNQVGNAVPPLLAKKIAEHLKDYI